MKYMCTEENISAGSILLCVADDYPHDDHNWCGRKARVESDFMFYGLALEGLSEGNRAKCSVDMLNGTQTTGGVITIRFIPWHIISDEDKFMFEMTGKVDHLL